MLYRWAHPKKTRDINRPETVITVTSLHRLLEFPSPALDGTF